MTVTSLGSNKYSFTMPSENVLVTVYLEAE